MLVGHFPLNDSEISQRILDLHGSIQMFNILDSNYSVNQYLEIFTNWIVASSYNSLVGIEKFKSSCYCVGTYDAIHNFVARHVKQKRIRFSKAEFVGAKICCNYMNANWKWLEDDEIKKDDAVVISLPFSGNGGIYSNYNGLIEDCEKLGVPVFLDTAYYGISYDFKIDLSASCITDISTSLTKPISMTLRSGIRFTKTSHDDFLQSTSDSNIHNRIACTVASKILQEFSHDWLVEKYKPMQKETCKKLKITPTQTFTLALGDSILHKDFERNGFNRICIVDEFYKKI